MKLQIQMKLLYADLNRIVSIVTVVIVVVVDIYIGIIDGTIHSFLFLISDVIGVSSKSHYCEHTL